jgi:type II secretory pathway pseudopilin PulG
MRSCDRRGQVWIETVIYTLIGLTVVGLVLAGALPKINAKKDEVMIDESIEALRHINDKMYEVSRATGNRRVVNLEIRKGSLVINPRDNIVSWVLDSSFAYSEVGEEIGSGNINITTTEEGDYEVKLELGSSMNLTFEGADSAEMKFDVAPTPYMIVIENTGLDPSGNKVVDFREA